MARSVTGTSGRPALNVCHVGFPTPAGTSGNAGRSRATYTPLSVPTYSVVTLFGSHASERNGLFGNAPAAPRIATGAVAPRSCVRKRPPGGPPAVANATMLAFVGCTAMAVTAPGAIGPTAVHPGFTPPPLDGGSAALLKNSR